MSDAARPGCLHRGAMFLLAIAGLLGLVFIILHAPPLQKWILESLVERASDLARGSLEIGSIDYRLWRADAVVRDVRFEPHGEGTLESVSAEEVRIRWLPLYRAEIRAFRPVVRLRDLPDDPGRAPRIVEPSIPGWIAAVRVTDAVIHYRGLPGENQLLVTMGPLEAHLRADEVRGGMRGGVRVERGNVTFGHRSLDLHLVEADVSLVERDIEVRAREIVTGAGRIQGEGLIEILSPFTAGFDLGFRLDAATLGNFLMKDDPEGIGGELLGSVRLEFGEDLFLSSGEASGNALAFRDFGPFDGDARWDLRDDLVRTEGVFHHGGERIELDTVFDLDRNEQVFTVILDAPSMKALLAEAGGPSSPWDSVVRARLSGRMRGWSPESLDGTGEVSLSQGELAGRIEVDAEPGRILVEASELRFPGGRGEARAQVAEFETLAAEYRLAIGEISTAIAPFVEDAPGWISGKIQVEGRAAGPLAEPATIRNSMRVGSEDFRLRGERFLLYARLDQQGEEIDFDRLSLVLADNGAGGELSATGEVDFGRRRMDLSGSLDSFPVHHLARVEGLTATAGGSFEVRGSFLRPRGTAVIDLSPVGVFDRELPPMRIDAESDGDRVTLETSRLDTGATFANARIVLEGDYLLEAALVLDALPWEELASGLSLGAPEIASIAIAGDASLWVPLTEPARYRLSVDFHRVSLEVTERQISTSAFELELDREAVRVRELGLFVGGEVLRLDGAVGLGEAREAALAVEGSVPLNVAEIWLPADRLEGVLGLDLALSGSLRDPNLTGVITLEGGRLAPAIGEPDASPAVENLRMRAEAAGRRIEIASLEAEVLGGSLRAEGSVPVPGTPETAPQELSFDITGIDPAALAGPGRAREIRTSLSLGGRMLFPEGGFDRIEVSGEIQDILIASEGEIIYLVEKAGWTYGPAGIRLDPIHLEGDHTNLRVDISAPEGGKGEAFGASIQGRTDLQIANAVLPDAAYLSGLTELDLEVSRLEDDWDLSGRAAISGGELTLLDPAFAVTDLRTDLELQGGEVRVRRLEARAGGGALSGEGEVRIPGIGQGEAALRLALQADHVRIEYPEGMRSEVTARLSFESREERYRLSGRAEIVQAMYERPISPEREILDALRRETLELRGEPGLLGRIDLDVTVGTERQVVVDNNLGQMRWSAAILVSGTLAAPEATGTLSAEPGGTLRFGRNTYEIESARIVLTTYPLESPELDIQARTTVGGREIALAIWGKTDNLRTTLESPTDPTLTRGDVASLLLTGRTLEEVRGEEVDVVGQEAAAYLGGSLATLTEVGLASALPLATIRLEPGIVGSETDPGVRFSIGHALTEDLFLTYSIGLDDPEKQLWIIDYSLPRRMRIRAIREDANRYTGGLSQEALFDFYHRDRPRYRDELPESEILAVRIEGPSVPVGEEIEEAIRLEAGNDYDYWDAREDADRVVEKLRERGHLSAQVEPYTEPLEVAPGEPVRLVYEVNPGPVVSISLEGEGLPPGLEDWVRERFHGSVPPRAQALRVGRSLRWELSSRGYYTATVEPTVLDLGLGEEVSIVFRIELGPRGSGVDVAILGNESLAEDEIGRLLPPTSSAEFFDLLFGRPDELREDLELLYAGEGLLEAEVVELGSRFDPDTSRLEVTIRIGEGERFRVGELIFSGRERLPAEDLRQAIELQEGIAFEFLTHLRDRQRITSLYRREGFPDVRVRSRLERGDGLVDVIFEIVEGERLQVGDIQVRGARATRPGVIRGALTFEPGEPLRLQDLTETQIRLYNLRVFRSVDVRPVPSTEEGERDVVVELTELPDLRVGYGARYNTEDQLELTGDLELTNLLGTARQLGFHAFANRRLAETRAWFLVPSFFGRDIGSSLHLSRTAEEGEGFESRAWSATFQQSRRVFSNVLAQWSFTHRQAAVRETDPVGPFPFDVEADRSVLSFSLIEDTRVSLTRPRSGRFWNATLQFAPEFLGSDLRFIKLYGQLFLYRPLWGEVVWASAYRAGIANGFGQVLLPTDRFRAGGPSSVRGFPVNELGPVDPILGRVVGGEGVVILNQELRIPLFWRFGGITFYDAGNVFLEGSDFNPLDLRHSTGLGLSVDLPVGLATATWAILLNPPPELPRTRWHFTFGYSF